MVPMKPFIVVLVLCITTAYGRSEILRVSENRFCDSDVKNEAISYMNYAIDLLDSSKSYPDYGSIVTNIAKGKKTGQKDTTHGGVSGRAVDGLFRPVWGSNSCTHTSLTDNPYWWVDLGGDFIVTSVWIQNRADCCHERLNSAVIMVGNDVKQGMRECARQTAAIAPGEVYGFNCHQNTRGSYVKVQLQGKQKILTLCEVAVFGYPAY